MLIPQSQEAFSQSAGFLDVTQVAGQTVFPILVESSTGTDLFWITTTGEIFTTEDVFFMSGTGFEGQLAHTITADRVWTFPDATGTVLLNNNVATVSSKTFGTGNLISTGFAYTDGIKQLFNPDNTNAGINIGGNALEPTSPVAGDLFFDSTANQLKGYDGTSWLDLGAGGTASQIIVGDTSLSVIDTGADGRLEFLPDGATDAGDTTGALNLINAGQICWEASPTGTDVCVLVDASENFVYTTDINQINFNSNPITNVFLGSDIDAEGFDITDLSNLEFRVTTSAPAGTVVNIKENSALDLVYNVDANDFHTWTFNDIERMRLDQNTVGALVMTGMDIQLDESLSITWNTLYTQRINVNTGGGMDFRVEATDDFNFFVDGGSEYTLSATQLDFLGNEIINLAGADGGEATAIGIANAGTICWEASPTGTDLCISVDVNEDFIFDTNIVNINLNSNPVTGFVAGATVNMNNQIISNFQQLVQDGDSADAGVIRLRNAQSIQWEADPTGTDVAFSVGSNENFIFGATANNINFNNNPLTNIILGTAINANSQNIDAVNDITYQGRALWDKGTDEASFTELTLATDGNQFDITGAVTIDTISPTGWLDGAVIHLKFDGAPQVTHDSGGVNDILLGDQANFATTAGDVLSLFFDGTDWQEISRSSVGAEVFTWTADHATGGNSLTFTNDVTPPAGSVAFINLQASDLNYNVPVGNIHQWEINGLAQMQIASDGDLQLFQNAIDFNLDGHRITPAGIQLVISTGVATDRLIFQTGFVNRVDMVDLAGMSLLATRLNEAKGADVVSAGITTLGTDGNTFDMTGGVAINEILATSWQAGAVVTLHFDVATTVNHNSGGTNDILLGDQANFSAVLDDVLTLYFNGVDWVEISRSVVSAGGGGASISAGDSSATIIDAGADGQLGLIFDGGDPSDTTGAINLANANLLCWEASPIGTDFCISGDANEDILFGTNINNINFNSNPLIGVSQITSDTSGVSLSPSGGGWIYDVAISDFHIFRVSGTNELVISATVLDLSGNEIINVGGADGGEATAIGIANAGTICWEASPTGTDQCISVDVNEDFNFDPTIVDINLNSNPVTGFVAGTTVNINSQIISNFSQLITDGDPADAGTIRLGNSESIQWESSPTGADISFTVDSSEDFVFGATANNINFQSNPLTQIVLGSAINANSQNIDAVNDITMEGRMKWDKGADIVGIDALILGADGNFFDITGTTTINHITNTNWQIGSVVGLHFDSTPTITHNAGSLVGDETNLLLIDSANHVATAGDIKYFILHDATTFIEITRNEDKDSGGSPSQIIVGDTDFTIVDAGADGRVEFKPNAETDPADTTNAINLANTNSMCWEADPAGSDICLSVGLGEALELRMVDLKGQIQIVADHTTPAQGQVVGEIKFFDDDSVGTPVIYGSIRVEIRDPLSTSRDGVVLFRVADDETAQSASNYIGLNTNDDKSVRIFEDLKLDKILNWANDGHTITPSATALTFDLGASTDSFDFQTATGSRLLINGAINTQFSSRLIEDKGADVVSAGIMTLGTDGNTFDITAGNTINEILATDWLVGAVIHLQFDGAPQVTHNSGGTNDILLGDQSNFATSIGDVLSLFFDGTDWQEISRSVVGAGGEVFTWTADHDADGFDLQDLSNLEFRQSTAIPASSTPYIAINPTNDMVLNVNTGESINFQGLATNFFSANSGGITMGTGGDINMGQNGQIIFGIGQTLGADGNSLNIIVPASDSIVFDVASGLRMQLDENFGLNLFVREQWDKGADVVSAGITTLGTDGNYFDLTGGVTINEILGTSWSDGAVVTLHFDVATTVTHNSGGTNDILLGDQANFSAVLDDVLTLVFNGVDWVEVSRSVVGAGGGASISAGDSSATIIDAGADGQLGLIFDGGDPSDTVGAINLANANQICWEASPIGTDVCIQVDATESFVFSTDIVNINFNSNPVSGLLLGNFLDANSNTISNVLELRFDGDPADAGAIRLANADLIAWESSPTGTDISIQMDVNENFVFDANFNALEFNSNTILGLDVVCNEATSSCTGVSTITGLGAQAQTLNMNNQILDNFQFLTQDGESADSGAIRLRNSVSINWEASPAGTDFGISGDTNEDVVFGVAINNINLNNNPVAGLTLADSLAGNSQNLDAINDVTLEGRMKWDKGADIVGIDALILGTDGNFFDITGTTTINHITNTNWQIGSVIGLHFDSTPTITHNAGSLVGDETNLLLIDSANHVATAGDTKFFILHDATTFIEIARNEDKDSGGSPSQIIVGDTDFTIIDTGADGRVEFKPNAESDPAETTDAINLANADLICWEADPAGNDLCIQVDINENLLFNDADIGSIVLGANPLEFNTATESISIQGGDMIFDVPTTDFFSWDIATVPQMTLSATILNIPTNNIGMDGTGSDIRWGGDSNRAIFHDTNGFEFKVPSGDTFDFLVATIPEYVFSASTLQMQQNSITNAGFIAMNGDPADVGEVRLANADQICWEFSPTGSEFCIFGDTSENINFGTSINQINLNDNPVAGLTLADSLNANSQALTSVGDTTLVGRDIWDKGADVVATTDMTLGTDGNFFDITGATQIDHIDNTGYQDGAVIFLQFDSNPILAHNAGLEVGDEESLFLFGDANFSTSAGDILGFVLSTTGWEQISKNSDDDTGGSPSAITLGDSSATILDTGADGRLGLIFDGGDPSDTTGAINLANANQICWEASPIGTDVCMSVDATESMIFSTDIVNMQFNSNVLLGLDVVCDEATSSCTGVSTITGLGTQVQDLEMGSLDINAVRDVTMQGRFKLDKGADLPSPVGGILTLGTDGNVFDITGSNGINEIVGTNWLVGSVVVLKFDNNLTIVHNSGGTNDVLLQGAINYAVTNGDVLTLFFNGVDWQEISRSAGIETFTWTADHATGGNSMLLTDDSSPPAGSLASFYLQSADMNWNVETANTFQWRVNSVIVVDIDDISLDINTRAIEFGIDTVDPASSLAFINFDDVQMRLNVPTGDIFSLDVAGVPEVTISATNADFTSLNIINVNDLELEGREKLDKATDVASTTDMILTADGNVFDITGTTTIDHIANTNWQIGSVIYLHLVSSALTLTHNSGAEVGDEASLFLVGDANHVSTAGDIKAFVLLEATQWQEIARNTDDDSGGSPSQIIVGDTDFTVIDTGADGRVEFKPNAEADPAETTDAINIANADLICWEQDPAGTDLCIQADINEDFLFDTTWNNLNFNSNPVTNFIAGGTLDLATNLIDNVGDIATGTISDETNTVNSIVITDTTGLMTIGAGIDFASQALTGLDVVCNEATSSCTGVSAITGLATQAQALVMGSNDISGVLTLQFDGDRADTGDIRFGNTDRICWESAPTGVDVCLQMDASEDLVLSTDFNNFNLNSNPVTGFVAGATMVIGTNIIQFGGGDVSITQVTSDLELDVGTANTVRFRVNNIPVMEVGEDAGLVLSERLAMDKGADVASITDMILSTDGNVFDITGVTTIDHIANTDWQIGSVITLHFVGALTLTHSAGAEIGDEASLFLIGDTNFNTVAGDIKQFVLLESIQWQEIARNVDDDTGGSPTQIIVGDTDFTIIDTGADGRVEFKPNAETDPAETTDAINIANADLICWEQDPAGTDLCIQADINEDFLFDTSWNDINVNSNDIVNANLISGNLQAVTFGATGALWAIDSADIFQVQVGAGGVEFQVSQDQIAVIATTFIMDATQLDMQGNEIINLAGADGGEATAIGIANAGTICWEASPTGTDFCISGDANEDILFGANINNINFNSNPITGFIAGATVDLATNLIDNVSDIATGVISDETNTVDSIIITDTTGALDFTSKAIAGFDLDCDEATSSCANVDTGDFIGVAEPKHAILTAGGATLQASATPTRQTITGTNFDYVVLDYADGADTDVIWNWEVPDNFDSTANIEVEIRYLNTVFTLEIRWDGEFRGIADAGTFDGAFEGTAQIVDDTAVASGILNTATMTFTSANHGLNAGELAIFHLERTGTNGADDNTGIGRLIDVKIEWG